MYRFQQQFSYKKKAGRSLQVGFSVQKEDICSYVIPIQNMAIKSVVKSTKYSYTGVRIRLKQQ